jgi:hypothetical protein
MVQERTCAECMSRTECIIQDWKSGVELGKETIVSPTSQRDTS